MLIASILGAALALAVSVAPAVAEFENKAEVASSSLVADRESAYYDPSGEYGDGVPYFYNYTSYDLAYIEEPNYSLVVGSSREFLCNYESSSYTQIFVDGHSDYVTGFVGDYGASLDLYYDGVFAAEIQRDANGNYILQVPVGSVEEDSYIWLFDHGTAPVADDADILGDIAEGLTGGIIPVAEGIGSGLQSLVQNIFLNEAGDGLSVFGIVVITFAALGLAFGLSRWVLNFVTSLGARNR